MGGLKYVALSVLALVAASVAIGAFFGWAALVLFPFGVFIGVATMAGVVADVGRRYGLVGSRPGDRAPLERTPERGRPAILWDDDLDRPAWSLSADTERWT